MPESSTSPMPHQTLWLLPRLPLQRRQKRADPLSALQYYVQYGEYGERAEGFLRRIRSSGD